ncbi:uncharacterized protein LOC111250275 isoform X3 [Varroa destructor]|uniref:PDZD8 N-terminal domain-containing protein n=2 Tax=Varroa TaxID=62624 RepID=A0A7M7KH48_VARDE|nr:uncharacterized protein LOC111250275 isoform X3 [Varroa destructor]
MQRDEGEPVSSERSMLWDVLHHLRHVDLIYFVGKFYEFLKEAKLLPIIIPCGLALFTVPLLPVIIAIVIHCVYYGISEGAWLDRHALNLLFLGLVFTRLIIYYVSCLGYADYVPPKCPFACTCLQNDEICMFISELLEWVFGQWKNSLQLQRSVYGALRNELENFFLRLRVYGITWGEPTFAIRNARVTKIEIDPLTAKPQLLEFDLQFNFQGEITLSVMTYRNHQVDVTLKSWEANLRVHIAELPYPSFFVAFTEMPKFNSSLRTTMKMATGGLTHTTIKAALRRTIKKQMVLPKYRLHYISPLGGKKLFLPYKPMGWSSTMEESTLSIRLISCSRLAVMPTTNVQALVQLSRRPLFNMDQVTFKPFVKFDIKARVSREVAAGVVLTDEVRDPDHLPYVKVLHIARGSRFDGCLKVGDFLQTINGVSIRGVKDGRALLDEVDGDVRLQVVRLHPFNWSAKKRRMTPAHGLRISKKFGYQRNLEGWPKCSREDDYQIAQSVVEAKFGEIGDVIHRTDRVQASAASFNKTFEFQLNRNLLYLNVAVLAIDAQFSHSITSDHLPGIFTNETFVILTEFQIYPLLNPHVACSHYRLPYMFESYVNAHGFDPRCCYGDIKLAFTCAPKASLAS